MFAKKALLGAAAMAVLTLAGCSTPDSHEPADLQDFREMVSPKVSWTASVGENDGYLTPAVTDNAVYAAGGDSLYRLDRLTGDKVWQVEAGSRIVAGVGSDGLHQAVVTDRGELEVYDAEGKFAWRASLSAETDVPPLVGQGLVVVKTSDTRITAFDVVTASAAGTTRARPPRSRFRPSAR